MRCSRRSHPVHGVVSPNPRNFSNRVADKVLPTQKTGNKVVSSGYSSPTQIRINSLYVHDGGFSYHPFDVFTTLTARKVSG